MTPGAKVRVAAYLLLALMCAAFAVILGSTDKYGTFAMVSQIVLSGFWLVAAFATWKLS